MATFQNTQYAGNQYIASKRRQLASLEGDMDNSFNRDRIQKDIDEATEKLSRAHSGSRRANARFRQRFGADAQQYRSDPSSMDAAKRNEIRQADYERMLQDQKQLAEWAKDPARRDPSGYTKIPTADGSGTRYAKISKSRITMDRDDGDGQYQETIGYRYKISEFDQGWENYNRQVSGPEYRNRVKRSGSGQSGDARAASVFTVGKESALGEGGREAARSATLTTTGAASKSAQAAAAAKRKLK